MYFGALNALSSPASRFRTGFTVCLLSVATSSFAQYGASPSQTGLFFDDLRQRAHTSTESNDGVRGGEAVYDYDRGVYLDTAESDRAMGEQATLDDAVLAQRQMGQSFRAGSSAYSARGAGDYTHYSSQYSTPSSFFAPTYVSDPFLGGRRNLALGPVNVGFGIWGGLEYNDNVTRASEDTVEDFIGTIMLNVDANYQITQNNRLTLTSAIGFDHYFNNPEVAPYGEEGFALTVLPGSAIAFDIKVGPVLFVVYNRTSVRPAVQNDFALSANQIFGAFQNDTGVAMYWDINSDWSLSLNYMHSFARSIEDEFDIYDRDMDSIQGNLTYSPYGTWSLGVEGGITFVRYPQEFQNDGQLSNVGLVFSTPLGSSTFLRVAGGYQDFDFDDPPDFERSVTQNDIQDTQNALNAVQRTLASSSTATAEEIRRLTQLQAELQSLLVRQNLVLQQENALFASNNRDSSDLSDYYYNVTLTNQLSSRINQVLSFGHESALNNVSNFVTADYVTYGIGFIAWRGSRISLSGYYEDADMSGGTQAEDLEQYGFDAYISHQINRQWRAGIGYHYGETKSNLVMRDYVQHSFNADVNFAINPKASVALGYRFFTTDADDPANDFDQNRVILAFIYNF